MHFLLPLVLISGIIGVLWFGDQVPEDIQAYFYTVAVIVKHMILLFLPLFIVVLLASSMIALRKKALGIFGMLILFVFCSNFSAVLYSYGYFSILTPAIHIKQHQSVEVLALATLFEVPKIQIISNFQALFMGVLLGIFCVWRNSESLNNQVERAVEITKSILNLVVIPLLPFMVIGFVFKMKHDGIISNDLLHYGVILAHFTMAQAIYALVWLFVIGAFSFKAFIRNGTNIVPAAVTGLATFSSAVTMPVTIRCTEKILHDKNLAHSFVPATSSVHLLGTAIGMNIIIFGCLMMEGDALPDLALYLQYAFYYSLTMFAVVGVPGGSIFALAPIIETYLGVSPEGIALITALVLLFDPIDTSFNISLNCIFSRVFEAICRPFKLVFSHE